MDQFVTTVKLDNELYSQFKEINVRSKISFQDFVISVWRDILTMITLETQSAKVLCKR